MNKTISVWRGSNPPPTKYHLWIQDDNSIYLHNGTKWDPIVDQDAFENLDDYLKHKQHSPKINLTKETPNDSDLRTGEFQLYRIDGDLNISDPGLFGKDQNFIAKNGDIYLQGKLEIKAKTLSNPLNPCLTVSGSNLNGRKVNLVFKNGDYELGVNSGGNVRTVYRQTEPTWELIYNTSNSKYKIKHIKTGKYLYYSSNVYTLNSNTSEFSFITKNSSIRSYELQRSGTEQCINIQSGSGWNYNISEWTKGDPNNELFIIDPSTFTLPKISKNKKETYRYKINFVNNTNCYFGNNGSYIDVSPVSQSHDFYFLGQYDNVTMFTDQGSVDYNSRLTNYKNYCSFQIRPLGYSSNQNFIIVHTQTGHALNAYQGINNGNEIRTYGTLADSGNIVRFIPQDSTHIINKIISTQCSTSTHDGLMSASDKAKLDQFQAASNYKTKQTAKSSPSASSTTYQFIDTISQDTNGVITATKKSVREATTSQSGLMTSSDKVKLNTLNTNVSDLTSKVNKLSWSVLKLEIQADVQNLNNYSTKDGIPILLPSGELIVRITGTPDEVIYYCGSSGVDIQRQGNQFTITQRSVNPGTIVQIQFVHPEDSSISTYISFIASAPGYDL